MQLAIFLLWKLFFFLLTAALFFFFPPGENAPFRDSRPAKHGHGTRGQIGGFAPRSHETQKRFDDSKDQFRDSNERNANQIERGDLPQSVSTPN